ncbi:MAG: glycosyltransferase [Terracidiphilus sp.]|jgi:glycosyltransferase involved in cell wall biosynthesis
MNSKGHDGYVLVTAAYNEAKLIERVLQSVVAQTVLPARWIVVSDGSTDRTDSIVNGYAKQYSFIQLLRLTTAHKRNFGAQVHAINEGCKELTSLKYEYIGNLDADVSFDSNYFAELTMRFERDPKLGLAGGFITEEQNGSFQSRKHNRIDSVAHAVQLFRRECFEAVGGYIPLKYGGPDWHAAVVARMKGWRVRSIPELPVRHHRPTGTADTWQRDCFRQGCMDFSLGSHPIFELIKCIRRLPDRPRLMGSLTRLSGFVWCYWTGQDREVPGEFVTFLRKEQMGRVCSLLMPWRFKSDDDRFSAVSLEG